MSKGVSLVTVFSKNNCFPCKITKEQLQKLGIPFVEERVDESATAMEEIKKLGYLQVPVVVTSEGVHWSGLQPDKIKALV